MNILSQATIDLPICRDTTIWPMVAFINPRLTIVAGHCIDIRVGVNVYALGRCLAGGLDLLVDFVRQAVHQIPKDISLANTRRVAVWGNGPSILGQVLLARLPGHTPGDRVAIGGRRIKGSRVSNPVDATGRILQFLRDCLYHTGHIIIVLLGINCVTGFLNLALA